MKTIAIVFASASLLLACNLPSCAQSKSLKWSVEYDYGYTIKEYPVENMMDGNPATTWAGCLDDVTDEGVKYFDSSRVYGDGILGFKIKVEGKRIDYLTIIAGYAKSAAAFRNNSVPTKIIVFDGNAHVNDGGEFVTEDHELAKPIVKKELKRTMEPQTVDLSLDSDSIWLILADVARGAKYNDLCISELSFFGRD